MPLPALSIVRLTTDAYSGRGVVAGSLGVILEVYGEAAYEVEFARDDGTTIAWFALPQHEVELVALPDDIGAAPPVRTVG